MIPWDILDNYIFHLKNFIFNFSGISAFISDWVRWISESFGLIQVLETDQSLGYQYMGGLALMVISPKNWELLPFFMSTLGIIQLHLKSFSDFFRTYRSKPAIICQNMTKKLLHSTSNQIQSFLNFELTIFKISYLIN